MLVTMAVVSIGVLVALFVATLIPGFNLGLAALSAAFLLGLLAGVPADEVTGFFPADFFVLIVGVTALFAAAQLNGTLDWLLDLLLRLVRGRVVLVALVPFVIGAVLTAVGTLPAGATAIVAPIALGIASRYRISPLVVAVLGITGIISGLLSPLAVYGVSRPRAEHQVRDRASRLGTDDLPARRPAHRTGRLRGLAARRVAHRCPTPRSAHEPGAQRRLRHHRTRRHRTPERRAGQQHAEAPGTG